MQNFEKQTVVTQMKFDIAPAGEVAVFFHLSLVVGEVSWLFV
jgi:hypothetical protein